jgi:FolB domain-containing protein
MDQVFISDLIARGIIGVNDWEREKPQEIWINIVLFADLHKVGSSDDIQDSVNYRTVAKKALAHAETAQRQTVEALAADIARLCLEHLGVRYTVCSLYQSFSVAITVMTLNLSQHLR